MSDAWRAYLEMALGLTEAPRKKAQKVAGDLVNKGGATAAQLQGLAEDLMSTGMANREALTNIVRYEVDRALGVVGLATAEEVSDLTARVRDLERQLRDAQARATAAEAAGAAPVDAGASGAGIGGDRLNQPAPLPSATAKRTVAKKAVKATPNAMPAAATTPPAKKAAAKKAAKSVPPAPAGTAEAPTAAVREAAAATELPAAQATTPAAKATPAKATPAKKTAAKKTAAKKAPGLKPAPGAKPDPEAKQASVAQPTPPLNPEKTTAAQQAAPNSPSTEA
jgi:polyhydroxyalkanoate synthesis regulator phasin